MKRIIISNALTFVKDLGFKGSLTDPLVRINPRKQKEFYIRSIKTQDQYLFKFVFETKGSFWYYSKKLSLTCELKKPKYS